MDVRFPQHFSHLNLETVDSKPSAVGTLEERISLTDATFRGDFNNELERGGDEETAKVICAVKRSRVGNDRPVEVKTRMLVRNLDVYYGNGMSEMMINGNKIYYNRLHNTVL